MKIDGVCQCGAVAYEAEADPANAYICNCTDCQTLAGSAFRWSVTVPESSFRLKRGEPRIFVKTLEDGTSGSHQVFCPDCGSPLYSTTPPGSGSRHFNIRVPGVCQRDELAPRMQYWKTSAPAWLGRVDEVADEGGVTL